MGEARYTLTAAEYWEWRTTIAELRQAELMEEKYELQHKLMQKDAEITMVRAQVFAKTKLDASKQAKEMAKQEYDRFKKALEGALGYSLNGKMIDDLTFEVKELPEEPK